MAQAKNRSRFVWQELMTDDTDAATAFYTKLLGWSAKGSDGDPAYTEFHAGAVGVAGMMKLPDSAKAEGAKPIWMPYISIENVDETGKEVEALGGKTIRPASDIPHVGRFAVLSDPQGAVFAIFAPSTPPTGPRPSDHFKPGEFSWQELATTDHEAAFTFYSKVFGWEELFRHDMGPMGTYLIFGADGVQYGGMFKLGPHHGPHPFWLPYAAVDDVDASAKVVSASNGRVVNGPMDVPGEGRIAQLLDPGGVLFAIHAQKKPAAHAGGDKPTAQASAPPPKPAAPKPAAPKPAAPKPVAASAPKKPASPAPAAQATAPASKPAPAPAAKPAAVTKPKPTPAVAAQTVATAPAAAKQVPAKKAPAAKQPVAKKAVVKKAVAKTKVVAKKKAAPKKKVKVPARKKVAAKPKAAAPPKGKVKKSKKSKKSKKDKKKDKKKSRKQRKKEKKARRKK